MMMIDTLIEHSLRARPTLIHSITTILWRKYDYYPYFSDAETAQRG